MAFQTDKIFFEEVAADMGMIPNKSGNNIGFERHPLAYLVEAADDICYTIIDFEDGINLGLVSEDFALEYLIKLVKDSIDTSKYKTLETKEDRISYLRALAIGSLINDAVKVFVENEEGILAGKFPFALMDKVSTKHKWMI
jgi:dGTPase